MSAGILQFGGNGASKANETYERIAHRNAALEELLPFVRGRVTGSVANWRELFAVVHDNFKSHLDAGLKGNSASLVLIDRAATIYGAEMKQAERLAQEARERVAARIIEEFGDAGKELAQALRDDDPQGFALDLDWND